MLCVHPVHFSCWECMCAVKTNSQDWRVCVLDSHYVITSNTEIPDVEMKLALPSRIIVIETGGGANQRHSNAPIIHLQSINGVRLHLMRQPTRSGPPCDDDEIRDAILTSFCSLSFDYVPWQKEFQSHGEHVEAAVFDLIFIAYRWHGCIYRVAHLLTSTRKHPMGNSIASISTTT